MTPEESQAPLYEFLARHDIRYRCHDHPPVFTCEEAALHCPDLVDINTKNLFLRDRKGKRHFLVVTHHHKSVDLKALGESIGTKLSFGSPERLAKHLGVEPGSVTILALLNDQEGKVELFLDEDVLGADEVACHPLVNTSTLVLSQSDLQRFLVSTGHTPNLLSV